MPHLSAVVVQLAAVGCDRFRVATTIDGQVLRNGSANFSFSEEREQDNDPIVIRDTSAAAKFDAHFERMWDAAQPMIELEPAIKALEPK